MVQEVPSDIGQVIAQEGHSSVAMSLLKKALLVWPSHSPRRPLWYVQIRARIVGCEETGALRAESEWGKI